MLQYDSEFRVLKIKINEKFKVLLNSFSISFYSFSAFPWCLILFLVSSVLSQRQIYHEKQC